MLQKLADILTRWCTRWIPDAYVIAIILTIITAVLALIFTDSGPLSLVVNWGNGFWELLTFAMQMCLVIMTGYILATTSPMRRLINAIAARPKTGRAAVAVVALSSMGLALINWGLSLVAGAVLVRAIARHRQGADYRLLVATAYLGVGAIFHAGLSGSAPLLIATPGHFLQDVIGVVPITETTFHPLNLTLAFITIVLLTTIGILMHPAPGKAVLAQLTEADSQDFQPPARPQSPTPALWIEHSPLVNLFVGACALVWLGQHFAKGGLAGINLNVVNFMFLFVGVLLHRTPASFLKAARESGEFIWGVAVQFPFYAGIFGIIKYSGLSDVISGWFTSIATQKTYPVIVMWYSGVMNYFVPSGGSKWAIEAAYIVKAAKQLGVDVPLTVIAYAYGDMSSNIIQPFWAIPLLGVAKLGFRDIMGYCVLYFIAYGLLISAGFLIYPLL